MTDRDRNAIQQEVDTILERLSFAEAAQVASGTVPQLAQPEQSVRLACLYHEQDERYWKRLNLHFETVSWQEQHFSHSSKIIWHIFRLSTLPMPAPASQIDYATLQQAHILLFLLSVDSLTVLKNDQELFRVLLEKDRENRLVGCPTLAGILIRPMAWKEAEVGLWDVILPTNERPLALWRERDEACCEIAEKVRAWIRKVDTSFREEEDCQEPIP